MEDTKGIKDGENPPEKAAAAAAVGGGGWGGWGFSSLSVLSDLQKAAQDLSRTAVDAAEKAAKSIAEMQIVEDDSEEESSKEVEDKEKAQPAQEESEDEDDKLRKTALDKLEKASDDSFLGQGLKAIDSSVENFASGAWQALGNALKGGTGLVHKIEHSAVNLAESIQQGGPGSVAPSLLETGKAFTAKGMQVLEYMGKETMDLLITETGIEIEKNSKDPEQHSDEDQLLEEVTFDRCFYIYGGPEQLEELESLSSHYALLFNRRKAKLSSEQKSLYDGKLKEVQQILSLTAALGDNSTELDKGKKVDTSPERSGDEMKTLHDSSVSKAADMAAGLLEFASSCFGLPSPALAHLFEKYLDHELLYVVF
ncbi:hypothetical protein ACFE04_021618 [Oxalis oulophora]